LTRACFNFPSLNLGRFWCRDNRRNVAVGGVLRREARRRGG
jgi:hypothetical protein